MLIILTDTTIRSDILKTKIHLNYSKKVKKYMDSIDLDYCLYHYFNKKKVVRLGGHGELIYIMMKLGKNYIYKNYNIDILEYGDINDSSQYSSQFVCEISDIYDEVPYKYELKTNIRKFILPKTYYLILKFNRKNMDFYNKFKNDIVIIDNKVYINLYDYNLKRLL